MLWVDPCHGLTPATITSGGNSYVYDFENRLVTVNNGAITFVYDADGNRVKKVVGSVTTQYLIDQQNPSGHPRTLEELNSSGGLTRSYVWGGKLISARESAGGLHFYGLDGHGNVRFL